MSEFAVVSTKAELALLDDSEMVAGYLAGFNGEPEPGSDKGRSFWHGWRNGASDAERRESDAAQQQFAREIVARHMKMH